MKHVLLTLLLCFGITSVAYAQEPVTVDAQAIQKVKVPHTDRADLKALRDQHLENKEQALEARAEIKDELKAEAEKTKAELRAQFDAATTTEAKQAIREQAAVEKEALRETAQEYKEDWRERVREYFKQRVELIFTKFSTFIEKAESAEARISSVLETLQGQGIDTSTVDVKVQEASAATASVKERMRTIKSTLEAAVETGSREEVRAAFNEAKADLKTAQRELKVAYSAVREAIAELKTLVKEQRTETTEESTDTSVEETDGEA